MSKTTTNPLTKEELLKAMNEAVTTAYFGILSEIKSVLTQFPTEYLRTYCEVDYNSLGMNCKHGFFSPLIHLQLIDEGGILKITFSRNLSPQQQVGSRLNNLLSRIVYKHTDEESTKVFIEDSLNCVAFSVDDYRQAINLIAKGYKEGQKVTV
jgi:hypothetical protein